MAASLSGCVKLTEAAQWINDNGCNPNNEQRVFLIPELNDEHTTKLFAWISRAFAGDTQYNNSMLAIAAVFGNLPPNTSPIIMLEKAMSKMSETATIDENGK
eukprot:8780097-Ditylum_brightwellii.AAC.1